MAPTGDDDEKPWKTDLARKSAQRREQVLRELEESIRKATSFEEALRQAVELMKRRFARYSGITAYVADGEDLAVYTSIDRPQGPEREVYTSIDRPQGPERVWSGGGPLADAAQGQGATVVSDLSSQPGWGT